MGDVHGEEKRHGAGQNYVVRVASFLFPGSYLFLDDDVEEAKMGENVACTGKRTYRILVGNLTGRGLGVDDVILIK